MKESTIKNIIKHPLLAVKPLAAKGMLDFLPDKAYLKILYYSQFKEKLNIDNPQTFNEKIQWLKLNDRNPIYIKWVDKIEAKKIAANTIGGVHIVPLIATWASASEISFEELPDICVLKCNHDQGSTIIYRRGISNEQEIRKHFENRLKRSAFSATREWPYSQIIPMILCEQFMADNIVDYKFFCFNGTPRIINIGQKSEVDKKTRITFLDTEWHPLSFQREDFDRVETIPPKPKCYDELLDLAKKMSAPYRFVRTDFFVVDEKIYFSEFTLYPTSGLIKFSPRNADLEVGSWLKI